MLHYEAIEPGTLEILEKLNSLLKKNNFYLGGGTALALIKGHRLSIDLDFFTQEEFTTDSVLKIVKVIDPNYKVDQYMENSLSES